MVPAQDAGGAQLTIWDYYENDRVRKMTQGGVTRNFLKLDPLQRITIEGPKFQPAEQETFHYSDDTDAPSWTAKGSTWTRYLSGPGGMLSALQQGSGNTAGAVTYQLTNLHGDVAGEADALGQLTQTLDADEFGVPQGEIPSSGYGWLGGKERRSQLDSGVITMGQRVYEPHIGRFLQTDPVQGGSANDYDYANADPLNQFDLNGTWTCGRKCRSMARAGFRISGSSSLP